MTAKEKMDSTLTSGALIEDNCAVGDTPEVLTRIYDTSVNLVVLERSLTDEVTAYSSELAEKRPGLSIRTVIKPEDADRSLVEALPKLPNRDEFVKDLALLVDMYGCLFELNEVGVRLQVLDRAMCPRFHTDKLGCRMVVTYLGAGTEWLPNWMVDRSRLGAGNLGLSDELSGLYPSSNSIRQVNAGDLVLLKGDGWFGNEGNGAVHRSPAVAPNERRVLITLDFA